jgi:hypothetical protein
MPSFSSLEAVALELEQHDFYTTMTLTEDDGSTDVVWDELTRQELFERLSALIDEDCSGSSPLLPDFPAMSLKDLREVDPAIDSVSLNARTGVLLVALGPMRAALTVRFATRLL